MAPNQESGDNVFIRAGLDMGDVNLHYDTSIIELNKIDVRNRGYFYEYGNKRGGRDGRMPGRGRGSMRPPQPQDNFEEIPYIPGGTYKFEVYGTDKFSAITVEAVAPDNKIQITTPTAGDSIDANSELKVTWSGGLTDQNLVIILLPEMDRTKFRGRPPGAHRGGRQNGNRPPQGDQFDPPDRRNSFGGQKLRHPMFSEYAARYVVEQNSGEFTFSADDIQKVLSHPHVKGLRLEVMQTSSNEINDGSAKYVVQFRSGDLIRLNIQ